MDNLIWGDRSPIYSSLLASFKSFLLFCWAPIIPTDALKYPLHDRLMFCTWQRHNDFLPHILKSVWLLRHHKAWYIEFCSYSCKTAFLSQQGGLFWPGCFKTHGGRHGGHTSPPCIHDFFSESELPKERLCKWHHTHSFSLPFFPSNRTCRFQILLLMAEPQVISI